MVIAVAVAGAEIQFRIVTGLRHFQHLLLAFQEIFLLLDLRLEGDGMVIDIVRREDAAHIAFDGIFELRDHNVEILAVALQFEALRQVEFHIVARFGQRDFVLRQLRFHVV